MTTKRQDPLAGFVEIQRCMAESLRPFAEMQERIKALTVQPPWLAG